MRKEHDELKGKISEINVDRWMKLADVEGMQFSSQLRSSLSHLDQSGKKYPVARSNTTKA